MARRSIGNDTEHDHNMPRNLVQVLGPRTFWHSKVDTGRYTTDRPGPDDMWNVLARQSCTGAAVTGTENTGRGEPHL